MLALNDKESESSGKKLLLLKDQTLLSLNLSAKFSKDQLLIELIESNFPFKSVGILEFSKLHLILFHLSQATDEDKLDFIGSIVNSSHLYLDLVKFNIQRSW